eukprot:CAMPEP_0184971248 /NCGR_PEP_ID=MMETSP1098-20130426/3505_1 /TAXON_ID=89044 /ORGANISM="Spumella elongata, Strain CCAP 955/1" /LENGTH=666 /DNA_ID=CAMNT_0027493337 /DNA_START=74 /DNA_END=2074 /DNA_ORIENTATION=+
MVELSKLKSIFGVTGHSKVNANNVDDILAAVDENLPLTEDNVKEAKYLAWQLNNIVADAALDTNAKTRRRIKRIMQRLGEAHVGVNFEEEYVEEPEPVEVVEKFDVVTAAQKLKEANTVSSIEHVLNGLVNPGPDSKTDEGWTALKTVLYQVLDDRTLTNKNIRRRISRLIFVLANESDLEKLNALKQSVVPPPVKKVVPVGAPIVRSKLDPRPAAPTPIAAVAVVPEPPKVVVVLKSFSQCLEELRAATSTAEVDAAIAAVSANSAGDAAVKQQVREKLESLALDDTLVSNTKIKRKVQRLIATLENAPAEVPVVALAAAASAAPVPESKKRSIAAISTAEEESNSNDIPSILKRLKTVHSAEELDAVLAKVDMRTIVPSTAAAGESAEAPEVTCDPAMRRLLKKSIEQVLSQEDVSGSMNAKVRRRVTRITGILADADGDAGEAAVTNASATTTSKAQPTLTIKPVTEVQKKVPYVLFVGNLSYDVTAAEIEEHLRSVAALEGPVKVRLRTDPHTKRCLGVAFVEVEGTRELHQCIAAGHHSNLHGRVINVEKSCGGRNKEQRGEKIATKRTEQQRRTQEAINTVLVQFEQKGVLHNTHKWGETLKDMLYAHSAASVTEIINNYAKLPKSEQKIHNLTKMLTSKQNSSFAGSSQGFEDSAMDFE